MSEPAEHAVGDGSAELGGLTLLVPALREWRGGGVARAWRRLGGTVRPVDRFWGAPLRPGPGLRVYGPDAFCSTLAARLGLRLEAPRDDLLTHLPRRLLRRRVRLDTLAGLSQQRRRPRFVKPVEPKLFRAQITDDPGRILDRFSLTRPTTPVLVADVVDFRDEVRVFVLDRKVAAAATYRGHASADGAFGIASELTRQPELPRAWVVDIGRIADGQWAVIEFNAVHAAFAHGCNPLAVARCLAVATAPVQGG